MNPLTLILDSLTAGAAASIQAVAGEAVKDSYNKLKALIKHKFFGNTDAMSTLAKYEKKPNVWRAPLEDELVRAGLDQDEEIIKVAQEIMKLVNPQQAMLDEFNVQISGNVQGAVFGNYAQQTNTFGDKTKE